MNRLQIKISGKEPFAGHSFTGKMFLSMLWGGGTHSLICGEQLFVPALAKGDILEFRVEINPPEETIAYLLKKAYNLFKQKLHAQFLRIRYA